MDCWIGLSEFVVDLSTEPRKGIDDLRKHGIVRYIQLSIARSFHCEFDKRIFGVNEYQ